MTVIQRLESIGFSESDTGGGFQALSLMLGDTEILVTTECDLPEEGMPIQVGWYLNGKQVRSETLNPPYENLENLIKPQTAT